MEVTQEEWKEWLEHPVTQALWVMLQRHQKALLEDHLAQFQQGSLLSDPAQEMQIKVAKAVGALEVYSYLLSMNEEDLNEQE